ncbi:MAG: NAD(P)/FAD-dependent oxidoreductase [Clostridiales bacterium]|nr:NAD(P)/FAD-dependent oxidoreductase [Clostridiales bacterium]
MKKIIVAGAGHGGLTAAYNLARNGCDVTVYEKKKREDMGHDWEDVMSQSAFNDSGMPMPPKEMFSDFTLAAFYAPSKKMRIDPPERGPVNYQYYVERKALINYLIDQCLSVGVKFEFERPAVGAVWSGTHVTGIKLDDPEEIIEDADLVIDAAGIDSPVRKSLPPFLGIKREIPADCTFYAYRAYYERKTDESLDPPYNDYFFHCGHVGMDWIICKDDCIDILVGKIISMTQEDIDESVNDFKNTYGFIGDKILRAGTVAKIPLSKTLPMIVADGYVLLGDSGCMIDPMSGSGINICLRAGKLLADVITEKFCEDLSINTLWEFQYKYFKRIGEKYLSEYIIRNAAMSMTEDQIEHLFNEGVLTTKEFFGKQIISPVKDAMNKVRGVTGRKELIPIFLKAYRSSAEVKRVSRMMPAKYNAEAVRKWARAYEAI